MAETIKNQFSKTKFLKKITEFGKNLFILEIWKRLQVVLGLFPEKTILDLFESHHFFKIWYEAIRKKVGVKIKFVKFMFSNASNIFLGN